MDGGYVGAKGAVQEGDRGGGSMGVTVCAVCPSGPVSLEIRLTRWCRALIINEPNFITTLYIYSFICKATCQLYGTVR